jgi:arabinose-5-phosphate isomerase
MAELTAALQSALTDARRALAIEGEAIYALADRLDDRFAAAVRALLQCPGRAVVCGIGKSGAIGRKLASTLASTGTPAFFLHPAEALHGDLGSVTRHDVVIVLSYSGETEEVLRLLPAFRRVGAKVIALCGKPSSTLARESDWLLDTAVEREACPLGLAPTASAAAMLALGDALAVAVMSARGFSAEEFAESHPAGAIGRKLLLRVRNLMHAGDENPTVGPEATVREALLVMTASPLRGVVSIVAADGTLLGIFTDGDLRRLLNQCGPESLDRPIADVMTREPATAHPEQLAADVARMFQEREFDNMPVVDEHGRAVGVIDVQDVLKANLI